ncbi:YihY/virulence factor BrkB family protein [Legionella septentrionalis]|uniref:YihY/virulence factor BrkB family protein n=1 Tax=Legionella septentrionalis TaxID=2498109 RepID=UPI000F8EFDE7|nr:YihY/virulence factor BrkB family protein [Legionella septentrionalis]RUR17412.1 YihY/virulence factor BrkB family protein [Legionella septentrionalis]
MKLNMAVNLLKETIQSWKDDRVSSLAAALAYYTIFSMAPLLIVCTAIAGFFFGKDAVQAQILDQVAHIFGSDGAKQIESMMISATNPARGMFAQITGIVVLLFGASGAFGELQTGLNSIWRVKPKPGRGIMGIIKDRFLSFTMVLGIGFLLLVSLVLTVILAAISDYLSRYLPGGTLIALGLNFFISLSVITALFAMIFKILPDVQIKCRQVWPGAFATTLLFILGKFLLGIYLGNSKVANGFGPAASLIIILIWVYYSAQILFLGAEFTKAYANKGDKKVPPNADAVAIQCK